MVIALKMTSTIPLRHWGEFEPVFKVKKYRIPLWQRDPEGWVRCRFCFHGGSTCNWPSAVSSKRWSKTASFHRRSYLEESSELKEQQIHLPCLWNYNVEYFLKHPPTEWRSFMNWKERESPSPIAQNLESDQVMPIYWGIQPFVVPFLAEMKTRRIYELILKRRKAVCPLSYHRNCLSIAHWVYFRPYRVASPCAMNCIGKTAYFRLLASKSVKLSLKLGKFWFYFYLRILVLWLH